MDEQLKLKDERGTFQLIAAKLRSGEIDDEHFDMAEVASQYDCGTVACIGGFAWLYENPKDFDGADRYVGQYELGTPLDNLFFFRDAAANVYSGPNKRQNAAQAIDNYLAGAPNPWLGIEP